MQRSQLRWLKVKQLLLLIVRTLIIIFLVLAFARPAFKSSIRGVGAEAQTSAVILLDNSYSMGRETKDGPLFELAKGKVESLLKVFGPADEVSVATFSDGADFNLPPFSSDQGALKRRLQGFTLSYRTTNVVEPLVVAVQMLEKSANLNREIYLLTDLTATGWKQKEKLKSIRDRISSQRPIRLYVMPFQAPDLDNLSVGELDFGRQLIELGRNFRVTAAVENHTDRRQDRRLVSLFLDGRRVAQNDVTLRARGKSVVDFSVRVEAPGLHHGKVELEDDQLLADNSRYFSFRIPETIDALLVGDNSQVVRHIRWALNPSSAEAGHLRVEVASPQDLPPRDLYRYDVVILAGLRDIDPNVWRSLLRFAEAGGGLFFSLGSKPDLRFYNREVGGPLFGVRLGAPIGRAGHKKQFFSWEQVDLSHPVFSVYEDLQAKPGTAPFVPPKFYLHYEAKTSPRSRVLGSLSNKDPILLEGKAGERSKALLLTSGFGESLSDISLRAFFVPFINRACEYLAQDLSVYQSDYTVGEEIQIELASEMSEAEIVVTRPDGERFVTSPMVVPGRKMASFGEVEVPGIYRFSNSDKEIDYRAVNVDPSESQPDLTSQQEIEKDLAFLRPTFLKTGSIASAVKESRLGRELWQEALLAVLALMAVEMVLARIRA